MSLLVMGIGVVSLATLFPISILRTARANQLTNATILFENAYGLMKTFPHLLHDPDNDGDYYRLPLTAFGANVAEHYGEDQDGDGTLDPGEDINGDGRLDRGIFIVDPLGWYSYEQLGLSYPTGTAPANAFENFFGNYGFNAGSPTAQPPQPEGLIPRFNGGQFLLTSANPNPGIPFIPGTTSSAVVRGTRAAAKWFVQRGGWLDVVTAPAIGNPVQNGNGEVVGITLDVPAGSLADVQVAPGLPRYRLTLFQSPGSAARPGSLVRDVTQVNGNTLIWSEDLNDDNALQQANEDFDADGILDKYPLPAPPQGQLFEIDRVRLEVEDWRFSWMLTVRKAPLPLSFTEDPPTEVDIVVFFRRSFREEHELIYAAHFEAGTQANNLTGWDNAPGDRAVDDDGDGNVDAAAETGFPGTDDLRTAYLFWNAGGTEPELKRGAWLFEAGVGRWYRIQDFRTEPTNATTSGPAPPNNEDTRATLLLEQEIATNSTLGALVMPNIIEVFRLPLERKKAVPGVESAGRMR